MADKKPSILVVDDIAEFREALKVMLAAAGYKVFEADNGISAAEIINSQKIDLILLDVVMPERGGIETLIDLKDSLAKTGIILMSGQIAAESEAFFNLIEQFGVKIFLKKPFGREELLVAVKDSLAQKT